MEEHTCSLRHPAREGSEKKHPDFFLFCLQFPESWDLPDPGIKPRSPALQAARSTTKEVQEYWSGWPIPSPKDLPDSGIEPGSPALQADSLPAELQGKFSCQHNSVPEPSRKSASKEPSTQSPQ